jgi:hypothetical protein
MKFGWKPWRVLSYARMLELRLGNGSRTRGSLTAQLTFQVGIERDETMLA